MAMAEQISQIVAAKEPDLFASGLHKIEHIGGGNLRFIFYVVSMANGVPQRVPLDRGLIMPIESVPEGIGKTLMALGRQVAVSASGKLTICH